MKRKELIESNFIKMKEEYLSSYNNSCRKIDAIFRGELKHFQTYLSNFNNQYNCIEENEYSLINDMLKEIFNSFKVMLVDNYASKFNGNVEALAKTMHDFFIKKLNNDSTKLPINEINKYLKNMCDFDFFKVSNKLEEQLEIFRDEFIYKYVNSEEAKDSIEREIKTLHHSIMCQLKKVIAESIEDKQDIAIRYNSLNKQVISMTPSNEEKKTMRI